MEQGKVVSVVAEDCGALALDYLRGMGMKLPQKYENQFIGMCRAYGLNPMKRECYAVGYGDSWNIITGYEVYLKRAERTGKLDGWECTVEGSGRDMVAKLTIRRKDWKYPFTHFVPYAEAVQTKRDGSVNSMWEKRPSFMLRKVCIAQGFRLCFPDELGGMPYTSDEMPEIEKSENERNVTPPVEYEVQNDNVPDALKDNAFESLLRNYRDKLGANYDTAYDVFNSGTDEAKEAMYRRCVAYLEKKGVRVA